MRRNIPRDGSFSYNFGRGVSFGLALGLGGLIPYVALPVMLLAIVVILLLGLYAIPVIIAVFGVITLFNLFKLMLDGDEVEYGDLNSHEE